MVDLDLEPIELDMTTATGRVVILRGVACISGRDVVVVANVSPRGLRLDECSEALRSAVRHRVIGSATIRAAVADGARVRGPL